ncbi:MAG: lipid-A-disaccharide synthase [Candidatus Puniceispirillales bacterium]
MKPLRLVVVVGEASGDSLAAAVVDGLISLGRDTRLSGIGGVKMLERGLEPVAPMDSLTVLGVGEAIGAVRRLNALADQLITHILSERPDAVLTVDSKGFNLRFARRLKARMANEGWQIPLIHAVAPTVWAWGQWRAARVATAVDRLLCLFPFEIPYFTAHGIDAVAIGHPSADRDRPDRHAARASLSLDQQDPVLALLPGSRGGEIRRLLPDMLAAVRILQAERPDLKAVLPMAESVADIITPMTAALPGVITRPQHDLDTVMAAADYGLICSGTVTLEAALSGLPGHAYYRSDAVSSIIGRLMVRRDRIILPNVITGQEIYPFSLGREFNAAKMAAAAREGLAAGRGVEPPQWVAMLRQKLTSNEGFGRTAAKAVLETIDGDRA